MSGEQYTAFIYFLYGVFNTHARAHNSVFYIKPTRVFAIVYMVRELFARM